MSAGLATLRREAAAIAREVHALRPVVAPRSPVDLALAAGSPPDPWQRDVLEARPRRGLLNCARQTGKSTTTAVLAVHTALYQPGSLTLLLSPTLRQSSELLKRCRTVYRALGNPGEVNGDSATVLTLGNGARIVSLPGSEGSIRGYSAVALLIVDEAARVPDAVYASALPMVGIGDGAILALSTPFGTRGWWWEAWAHGGHAWDRVEVPAARCPRLTPAFLAEAKRSMGEFWYRQEFSCEFLDAQSAAFRRADVEAAFVEVDVWNL